MADGSRPFLDAPSVADADGWYRHDLALALAAVCAGMTPTPITTAAEWADRHRILDSNHPIEGPYNSALTPDFVEIMECMSPLHPCRGVAVKKGVQDGMSDVMLNIIGTYIDLSPCPILILLPTIADAEKTSRKRLAPMIASCPSLAKKVTSPKSRDGTNTILAKTFIGGDIDLVGSNAPAALSQVSKRLFICDERDRCGITDEGDSFDLGMGRLAAFGNSKWLSISTPTDGQSQIEAQFLAGDQRHRYLPCPHCGFMQVLVWEQIRWPKGKPREAKYHCISETCGGSWAQWENDAILAHGQWIPHAPQNNPDDGPDCHRSYMRSNLYKHTALAGTTLWTQLAKKWEMCGKDPLKFQVFHNLHLAQCFTNAQFAELTGSQIAERGELYPAELPVVFVTLFCDVQADRLEATICGWGADEECWVHSHLILPGDPRRPEVWQLLTAAYRRRYFNKAIGFAGIDCGYLPDEVDKYLRQYRSGRFIRTRGLANNTKGINRQPIWNGRAKITRGKTTMFYLIGVDTAKHAVYTRLSARGPFSMIHFPIAASLGVGQGIGDAYYEQLTSEHLIKKSGVARWVLKVDNARNEALDCMVGNLAMCKAYQALVRKLPSRASRASEEDLEMALDAAAQDVEIEAEDAYMPDRDPQDPPDDLKTGEILEEKPKLAPVAPAPLVRRVAPQPIRRGR